MSLIEKLSALRTYGGRMRTVGLDDATIERFSDDADLIEAVDAALAQFEALKGGEFEDLLRADEQSQIDAAQSGYVNFYPDDAVNPYVALTARGPWIITLKGAVIHDSGGYGMIGSGHTPKSVLAALAKPQAMANIMTPSLSHLRMARALKAEVGQNRGGCPYHKFMCLNSGSESVSLAGRIADVNTREATDPGGPHAGWKVKRIAVKSGFHGRTELPALYSDSSRPAYARHLASWKHHDAQLITIEPYSVEQLHNAFEQAEREQIHIEAMFIEPVMGEGDPGRQVTPEFYAAARELTIKHGTLLLVDSIQAGLRAHGVLSLVDYPGFEALPAPDMETYSKALNAGQFPLSVLAVTERTAGLYRKGIYGNTMTGNPRAMDVAVAVLESLTPAVRANIREMGQYFLDRLNALKQETGGLITKVQGTGLLFSCELDPRFKCFGTGSTEEWLRERGLGVIHGGANSLRFTPHFAITRAEAELMLGMVKKALLEGPRKTQAEAA
ncbi:MAG: aminotransferase class III-fold pyridoxal phosphate-dependent enzyme [Xanthomonadaceae bacterium]|nr:aminotransferase class III-fold pyridoxal phosphate-dependent enzyme [Xanthomonadaceae bacterium]